MLPGSLNIRDMATYAPALFIPEFSRDLLRGQLGVSTVLGFRRRDELKRKLCGIYGIQVLSCPFKDGQVENINVDLGAFVPWEGKPVSTGYRDMYNVILKGYTTGYGNVLEALKSADTDHAVLFTAWVSMLGCFGQAICKITATGVMSALIFDLMGTPVSVIAEECALTRIGTEPFRAKMLPVAILRFVGIALADGDEASRLQDGLKLPDVREMLGSRAEMMADFMEGLKIRHGGAEGYLEGKLGFSEDDVRQIRDNLRP